MAATAPAPLRSVIVPDVGLALLVAALMLVGSGVTVEDDWELSLIGDPGSPWLPGPVGLLLLLAGSLPLAFRRTAPLTVLAVCALASVAYQLVGYTPGPLPIAVLVALYTVAVERRPLVCSAAAGIFVGVFTLGALTGWLPLTDDQYYIDLVSVVATVMIGYGVALSRARVTLAEQRATALARDQDTRMQAAVEQEQARIAREVHDMVAHDVSVIVAQASAARRVFETQPRKAADSLASIEAVGRDALDGLRRLLGLVRTTPDEPDRAPQPSLERLPWLLEQVRRAGLPVDLTIEGQPRPLPATVELNAYRIVQEALTNSLKHAGPTRATVVLDYRADSLAVEVRDEGQQARDGHGPNGHRSDGRRSDGYGLMNMQQRTAMLGGELSAGPEPEQGFRVAASLPIAGGVA